MEHWDAIADERRALADQLARLTPEQWATSSLCGVWDVRHVAAHLVAVLTTSVPRFTLAVLKARGSFDRANMAVAEGRAHEPTEQLVAQLRRHADSHFTPPGFGSAAPLTDVMVHGQDITVPLALSWDRPPARWAVVLDLLVTPRARRGFVPRPLPPLRYVATDQQWTHGSGPEVCGPSVALALTMVGRPARVAELTGPGVPTLVASRTAD